MSLHNREKLCLLQSFEPREAAEAQSIQTNLKVKQVWNLTSYAASNNLSPPNSCRQTHAGCWQSPRRKKIACFYKTLLTRINNHKPQFLLTVEPCFVIIRAYLWIRPEMTTRRYEKLVPRSTTLKGRQKIIFVMLSGKLFAKVLSPLCPSQLSISTKLSATMVYGTPEQKKTHMWNLIFFLFFNSHATQVLKQTYLFNLQE